MINYSNHPNYSILMKFVEDQKKENLNLACDFFVAKNNEIVALICDNFRDIYDVNDIDVNISAIMVEDGKIKQVGKLRSVMNKSQDVSELVSISVGNESSARLGVGSHMLSMFEQAVMNYSIRHINGMFVPMSEKIATDEQVARFYTKNGYGLCAFEDYILLYKNFDGAYNAKPIMPNEEYISTDDYKHTTYGFDVLSK